MGHCSWRERDDQDGDDVHPDTSLTLGIDRISKVYERIRKDSLKALEWSQELQKLISRIGSDLGFITTLRQSLLSILQQIETSAKTFDNLISLEARDLAVDISHAMGQYTMESERDVYRQVRGKENAFQMGKGRTLLQQDEKTESHTEGMPQEPNNNPEDQHCFGDNVEFF